MITAVRLVFRGRVQGVGFRPHLARLARRLTLAGFVANATSGVVVHLEGDAAAIETLVRELSNSPPPRAVIDFIERVATEPLGLARFEIREAAEVAAANVVDSKVAEAKVAEAVAAVEGKQIEKVERCDERGRARLSDAPVKNRIPVEVRVPFDVRTCEACWREWDDANDRRYGYSFVSCTDCGPRYSVISQLPFERWNSSMDGFSLCEQCRREYESIDERRFHSQLNACPQCGPDVWAEFSVDSGLPAIRGGTATAGRPGSQTPLSHARGVAALEAALATLNGGGCVALKGLGGYLLLASATNEGAVRRVRERKQRPAKPLAVLVADLAAADELAVLSPLERQLLAGPAGPIVLVQARGESRLAPSIHPRLGMVGLMLPTTPLHGWLTRRAGPLVATSGNVDGLPLAFTVEDARRQLSEVADMFVHHDREIVRPIDDSVVRVIRGRPVAIRAARGIAPLALDALNNRRESSGVMALGGHQKSALALGSGAQCVLGPHIGDLDSNETRQRWCEQIEQISRLYGAAPSVVVHDLHPDYFSTRWAEQQIGVRRFAVQHHVAHVLAAMCEHRLLDREVLGIAWDGTGAGTDGTVWGGEFLVVGPQGWRRVATLRPMLLVGGERAIREPWRATVAVLLDCGLSFDEIAALVPATWPLDRIRTLSSLAAARGRTGSNSNAFEGESVKIGRDVGAVTTSAGRLFDAVAGLLLPPESIASGATQYEGQWAQELEAMCSSGAEDEAAEGRSITSLETATSQGAATSTCSSPSYGNSERGSTGASRRNADAIPRRDEASDDRQGGRYAVATLDWRPIVERLVAGRRLGESSAKLATLFHADLAQAACEMAATKPELPVVLTGGVFQNRVLVEQLVDRLERAGRAVGSPGLIPPGDGGLAVGQLVGVVLPRRHANAALNASNGKTPLAVEIS